MSLRFKSSLKPTIGVELELQVLDPNTFDLIESAETLLKVFEKDRRVTPEIHQSTVEVNSVISVDVKECHSTLMNKLIELKEQAKELGFLLSMSGTHPFQKWSDRLISPSSRYQDLHEKYQWLIRRMDVYGLHVHIGMEDKEQTLSMIKAVVPYLPHLIALSANSPFWQGIDTGTDSSRINIMESFPFSGLPPPFSSWEEFTTYYETLKKVGAVGSLKDLYWHIRPSPGYGTLEFRICDATTTLSEAMALTAFIQCLVVFLAQDEEGMLTNGGWRQEWHWIAPENNWIAARYGLEGWIIKDLEGKRVKISEEIDRIIQVLLPTAEKLNCKEELLDLYSILEEGNGAMRQRRVYQERGSLFEVAVSNHRLFEAQFAESEDCMVIKRGRRV